MRMVLAFDKYRGALSAEEACEHAAEAVLTEAPSATIRRLPLSDGGEGFARSVVAAIGGAWETVGVRDPLGRPVEAGLGWVAGEDWPAEAARLLGVASGTERIAVADLASASGLRLLPPGERDAEETSTHGVGDLLRRALAGGANRILLGLGGAATNDLGAGALQALGAEWPGVGERLRPGLLGDLPDPLPPTGRVRVPLVAATDVDAPLFGPAGASHRYGPQKGVADPAAAERALQALWASLERTGGSSLPPAAAGSGAAGGAACGLGWWFPVRRVSGFEVFAAVHRLEEEWKRRPVVWTGEGRVDAGSLTGKGPVELARRALGAGCPVYLFPGRIAPDAREELRMLGPHLHVEELSPENLPLGEGLATTGPRLRERVARATAHLVESETR